MSAWNRDTLGLPSDIYFERVRSLREYQALKNTGMAWEVEPNFPSSWDEHVRLKQEWLKRKIKD